MSDTGILTIGTKERIEALEAYARKASAALERMGDGGRYEVPMIDVAGLQLADPIFCAARVETKLRNARMRRSR